MYKLIIDLEMCDKLRVEHKHKYKGLREIIQIGAVLLDDKDNEINKFETYVKPRYSILRSCITDLTHIEQRHIDSAPDIERAFKDLCDIIIDTENTILYTWSDTDTQVILKEMQLKNIDNKIIKNLCNNYTDIQKEFSEKVNIENRMNLAKALSMIGMDFSGVEHGALADAINTTRIYKELQNTDGVQSIINRINELMTEEPCTSTIGSMIDFSKFNIQ